MKNAIVTALLALIILAAVLMASFSLYGCKQKAVIASPEEMRIPVASPSPKIISPVPTSQAAGGAAIQSSSPQQTQQTGWINISRTYQGMGMSHLAVFLVAYLIHSPRSKQSIIRRFTGMFRRGPPKK